jgi:nucleoside-diphosphate-sugar epimerase
MITDQTIFITGGAGFIGTALSRYFLAHKNRVIAYDLMVRNSLQYFPEIAAHPNFELIEGDIRDPDHLKESIRDAAYVFHLAAIAGVSKYFKIPAEVLEVNIVGTYNILEAIKNNQNIRAFIDFSTSEIYGSNCFNAHEDGDVKMENLAEKRWTYATSKMASEKFGMSYFWQYNVPFIGVRPFNIYGPGQVGEGVISYFLNSAIQKKPISITGDGGQCRTFCYIEDFIRGIEILLNHRETAIGQSYNIGRADEIISIAGVADLIRELANPDQEIAFVKHQGEDVMVRSPNIDKLKALGYAPEVKLREGLMRTCNWYRTHQIMLD